MKRILAGTLALALVATSVGCATRAQTGASSAWVSPASGVRRINGWNVIEADGHDIPQLIAAFEKAQQTVNQPSVIIAHTVKGKGVSFMENNPDFHGKAPSAEEMKIALKELE